MLQLDLFANAEKAGQGLPVLMLLDGRQISYTLRRSSRAKNVWLRIGIGTGLVVVAPEKMPLKEISRVLKLKSEWIQQHSEHLLKHAAPQPELADGTMLSFLGARLKLRLRAARDGNFSFLAGDRELAAAVPDGSGIPALREALKQWYKQEAREYIEARVAALADGKAVGRVSIKDQRTRWGSCSSKGNLNFNWRLVMAPPEIMDYIVVHELSHLEHPNHSKKFWAVVERRMPDFPEREKWLKKHGRELVIP